MSQKPIKIGLFHAVFDAELIGTIFMRFRCDHNQSFEKKSNSLLPILQGKDLMLT